MDSCLTEGSRAGASADAEGDGLAALQWRSWVEARGVIASMSGDGDFVAFANRLVPARRASGGTGKSPPQPFAKIRQRNSASAASLSAARRSLQISATMDWSFWTEAARAARSSALIS
jgi:hypothetical protein